MAVVWGGLGAFSGMALCIPAMEIARGRVVKATDS